MTAVVVGVPLGPSPCAAGPNCQTKTDDCGHNGCHPIVVAPQFLTVSMMRLHHLTPPPTPGHLCPMTAPLEPPPCPLLPPHTVQAVLLYGSET